MTPTPPDRSVEEIVAEFVHLQNSTDVFKNEAQVNWLRTTLTSLHTLGIEAGRREGYETALKDVDAKLEALNEGAPMGVYEEGFDYGLDLARKVLATLMNPKHDIRRLHLHNESPILEQFLVEGWHTCRTDSYCNKTLNHEN